jgi:hypothetical protein
MSMIGESLAHYEITSRIGKGSRGEVYQANDQKMKRNAEIIVLLDAKKRLLIFIGKTFAFLGLLLFVLAEGASAQVYPGLEHEALSGCGDRLVAIIVEPALLSGIRSGLTQFEMDLCDCGYNTVEHSLGFVDALSVRNYLRDLYRQSEQTLAGVLLIGNIPYAYQWVVLNSSDPSEEEVISFQYYADLDGTFAQSSEYHSEHYESFDLHYDKIEWEIWVGILPRYNADQLQTITAINRYFTKNHAYRTGQYKLPEAFLEVNELHTADTLAEHETLMNIMRSGVYSWTPYSNSDEARIYFDSPPAGLSVDQGYDDLSVGMADFTVLSTHGYWGASGKLTIDIVESTPIRTFFLWSSGCAVGNLDYASNVLTSFLYSETSDVLIAKGTTNNSGGMGNNSFGFYGHNVASALAQGGAFGDAVLSHVNVPLIYPWSESREFHFATAIMLGDPTLRHRGDNFFAPTLTVTTPSLPHGTMNTTYSEPLRAAGGTQPYSWSVISGTLPSGLELDSITGEISGVPSEIGTANIIIGVVDGNLATATRPLSISVNAWDFAISSDHSSATMPGGSSANFNIIISPLGFFDSNVKLSCALPLKRGVDCTFVPDIVAPKSTPMVSILTITTTAPQSNTSHAMLWFGIPVISLLIAKHKRTKPNWVAYGLLLLMIAITACCGGTESSGGGGSGWNPPDMGTPTGMMNITVQATSGATTRTLGLEIYVQ